MIDECCKKANVSKDNTVQVQIGIMKMKIDIEQLRETETNTKTTSSKSNQNDYQKHKHHRVEHPFKIVRNYTHILCEFVQARRS